MEKKRPSGKKKSKGRKKERKATGQASSLETGRGRDSQMAKKRKEKLRSFAR